MGPAFVAPCGAGNNDRMRGLSSLLVALFLGVFFRRSVAYWVLLHLMRNVTLAIAAAQAGVPIHPPGSGTGWVR